MSYYDAGGAFLETDAVEQPRMSGLAIAALVCALLVCVPFLPPIGVILGLIAVVTMVGKPHLRGRGMAIAAIVVGLIFSVAWGVAGWFIYSFGKQIERMPTEAMVAGTGGDYAAFRDRFNGDGATASDSEVRAFFSEVNGRYGEFRSMELDRSAPPPRPGDAQMVFPYIVVFENASIPARVEFQMMDENTGSLVNRLSSIELLDRERGNLRFPPLPSPPTGLPPAGPAAPPADASASPAEPPGGSAAP
ncbi:MAG TPA: DUF4190 domain-containing protein [Phycisphaerales bacterium]|nr:DUF4190 domain-containing protein [Phycisphaerales bacterium]HMP36319.1 DUF4190 domain-containing protein [Phycisphaerales bacterium]